MTPQSPRDLFPNTIPLNDAKPGMLIATGPNPESLITIRLMPDYILYESCIAVGTVDWTPNGIRVLLGQIGDSRGLALLLRTASELQDGKIPFAADHSQEMRDGTQ